MSTIQIREAVPQDAGAFLALYDQINGETEFMLWEAGEMQVSVETQTRQFEQLAASGNGVTLLAATDTIAVGFLFARRNVTRRQAHCLSIGLGVLQSVAGTGIGRRLMVELERWALPRAFHRLELLVNEKNSRAIALYRSLGFEYEGVRKHALKIDGKYVDLFYMGKLIGD